MAVRDIFLLVKAHFKEKNNIIFIFVLTILVTIIFGCSVVMNFSLDVKKTTIEEDIGFRVISTNMDENKLSKLEHVDYFINERFSGDINFNVQEFNTSLNQGNVSLYPLLPLIKIEIVKGRNIINDNEVICPEKFYPYSYDNGIDNSLYLSSDEIIGKMFKIESLNEDREGDISELKIVGTYKNKPFVEANTCYVNMDTYSNNKSKYSTVVTTSGPDGTVIKYNEYKSNIVFVDSYKNVKDVAEYIENSGYYADYGYLDEWIFQYLFYIPLFICLIVLIVSLNIIYSFIIKKNNYRNYYYGILKSVGYQNSHIIKTEILENITITFVSCFFSLILIFPLSFFAMKKFMSEFIYYNYYLYVPIPYLILIIILILVLLLFMTKYRLNKILKTEIFLLLKNGGE